MQELPENIRFIGVDDPTLDLFENQYPVSEGVSYNAYLILDEKTLVLDTVDARAAGAYLENLHEALQGRSLDYLVVSHVEPDHTGALRLLLEAYPQTCLVGNAKTFKVLENFISMPPAAQLLTVKEGDTLPLGRYTLTFLMAPMIHWPEVMVSYEAATGTLFSADAFGRFGSRDAGADWDEEARRYYCSIVGKYGTQVQGLLKKAASLNIQRICPLHGPILTGDLTPYLDKYRCWSTYTPDTEGVAILCASLHGNTFAAAGRLAELLRDRGCPEVALVDLSRTDVSLALARTFQYGRLVLAASTCDGGVMPLMERLLGRMKAKNLQNRTVGLVENGSWAPWAAKVMRQALEEMKNMTIVEPCVTLHGPLSDGELPALEALAAALW